MQPAAVQAGFLQEVVRGLQQPQKSLPCKLFYDERGSRLFDRITELDEYYPTRTELAIMEQHVGEMTTLLGSGCLLVEYGSGSSTKTRLLLDRLEAPAGYVPIDISAEHLARSAAALTAEYPHLEVLPVCADYTRPFDLPTPSRPAARSAVYFPGSTIGNFEPEAARRFLAGAAGLAGPKGALLIGVDLKKDPQLLHDAYNDRLGVTAQFNLNILAHLNAAIRLDAFRHYAFYNPTFGRIEMHLVSLEDQQIRLGGGAILFRAGESIWTESSYKYRPDEFEALAAAAGWRVECVWTDPRALFSVQYLTVRPPE
jgi:dimethylhistidine N-methyltransferase